MVHPMVVVGQQEQQRPRCARQVPQHGSGARGNRTLACPGGEEESRQVTVVATHFAVWLVALVQGIGKVAFDWW